MSRRGALALLALLCLVGPSVARATDFGRKPGGSTLRHLALGDSYTIGEGVAPAERWPTELVRLLGADSFPAAADSPEIIARTGWTTDELSAAIDQADPKGPYDLVTLLIGVNDQYRGRSVEAFRPEFRSLLVRAIGLAGKRPGRVLVLSIPDWGVTTFAAAAERFSSARIATEIDAYNAVVRSESARAGAAYLDITGLTRAAGSAKGELVADGLHPSALQYRRWARAALPLALRALAGR